MQTVNISQIVVADKLHNGLARLHLDDYLGPAAQTKLDELLSNNSDIATATLLTEEQIIVIELASRTEDPDRIKTAANGFSKALKAWYDDLDELEISMMTYRPNPRQDAHKAYSSTHADGIW